MSPAVSVQWTRPVRQAIWERLLFLLPIAFVAAMNLLYLLAAVKAGSWGWGALLGWPGMGSMAGSVPT